MKKLDNSFFRKEKLGEFGFTPKDTIPPGQLRMLFAILEFCRTHPGRLPTYRALKDMLGFSSLNGVHTHVAALRRKGLIEKTERTACIKPTVKFCV